VDCAFSKAGGGKSFGSTGTHSYSGGNKYVAPNLNTPKSTAPINPNINQNQPSFLRNFFGGLVGSLAGIALFSMFGSLFGFSGPNSSVAGIFLIVILGILVVYLINFFAKRRTSQENLYNRDSTGQGYNASNYSNSNPTQVVALGSVQAKMDVDNGLREIEKLFPTFSEEELRSKIKDIFLNIQKAWSGKNMGALKNLVTDEMFLNFQKQIEELNSNGTANIVDNISVKRMELLDAWMEDRTIYTSYKIEAIMLDYDVDRDGNVLRGNKDRPIDFQEIWSFVSRDSINWELSAINQI
jgi:predicted lipid-binding transport protein (Tim44 family)